jgi:hypothetical protein
MVGSSSRCKPRHMLFLMAREHATAETILPAAGAPFGLGGVTPTILLSAWSMTHGDTWIAGLPPRGPWFLSIDHPGVAAELATLPPSSVVGPGLTTFRFDTLTALHAALDRVYKLAFRKLRSPDSVPRLRICRRLPKPSGLWCSGLVRKSSVLP